MSIRICIEIHLTRSLMSTDNTSEESKLPFKKAIFCVFQFWTLISQNKVDGHHKHDFVWTIQVEEKNLKNLPNIPWWSFEKVKVWGSPWTAIYGKPGKAFQVKRTSFNLNPWHSKSVRKVIFDKQKIVKTSKLSDCQRWTWVEMGEDTLRHWHPGDYHFHQQ